MNATITYDSLFNRAYADLLDKELSSKVILCLAPIACIIDLLIVYTIWRTKELHNKSHLLMLSLSMSHAIYTSQMVIWNVRVLIRVRNSSPLIVPSWLCILNAQQIYLPFGAFGALCLNLAIDRFMCVMTPIFYRQINTKRYILIINLVAYLYNILIILLSVIGTDIYAMFDCENMASFNYNIFGTTYVALTGNVRAGLLAILYGSAACKLIHRYKSAKLCGSMQKSEWRRQWEIRVFTAMSASGAMAIFMRLTQGVVYFASTRQADVRTSVALKLVGVLVGYIEGMVHLAIYLLIDEGFRLGFRKAILEKFRRQNGVAPMANY